ITRLLRLRGLRGGLRGGAARRRLRLRRLHRGRPLLWPLLRRGGRVRGGPALPRGGGAGRALRHARPARVLDGARGHTPAARGRRDGRLTQLHLPSTTSLLRWWGREAVQQLPETVVDRRQVPLHRVPWGRQPPAHQGASVPAEATPIFGSISVPPRTCLTLWRIASVSKSPSSTGAIPPPTRIESGALTNTSGCS